jgi:hypothetical protein
MLCPSENLTTNLAKLLNTKPIGVKMKIIQLPEDLILAMLTKIAERPYIEVHDFIAKIQKEVLVFNPPNTTLPTNQLNET